jgi:hypothetical protein
MHPVDCCITYHEAVFSLANNSERSNVQRKPKCDGRQFARGDILSEKKTGLLVIALARCKLNYK